MINRTKHAGTNYKMLMPFVTACRENDGYIKCESGGYMPLVIEKLWYSDCLGNPVYSMAHYGVQNGDLMRDPDITFSVDDTEKRIIPQTFQNDYLGLYQEVFKEINGKMMYSQSLLKDLDSFMWDWLNNIEMQGFTPERKAS